MTGDYSRDKVGGAEAFPLAWPPGWPRHKGAQDSDRRFHGPTFMWNRVYRGLVEEVRRIGGTQITVSTNMPLRQDGEPYAQQRNIPDTGVAVYFMRNGKPMVMAQDRFWSIIGNMRSLTMAIEGLRQMERHGGGTMMERAFDGFLALPPAESCWSILGLSGAATITRDIIVDAFKTKARENMNGGDMDRLVRARDMALEEWRALP
jgi:hypothetical protein